MARYAPKQPAPWLSIGRGGWSLHFKPYSAGALDIGSSTLSHYANTWVEHLDEIAPDALGTDTTVIANSEDLVRFAVSGPMGDPEVPAGMVRSFMGGLVAWRDEPVDGRDARFGSAGSLDLVALDVYATLVQRFGGDVFDPHERARELMAAHA